ncbi:MAG: hypothetical protein GY795_17685, partial [Desulfobacterales bacterium]|nr:hypothetical protein [Desulfobacterales bacterium]
DVITDEDSADTVIDLGTVFSDIDNDDSAITKSVQSDTGDILVAATVSGNTLTLDYQTDQSGTAVITVAGTSGGQTVTDDFTVTVNDVNNYISGKITYYSNGDPVSDTLLTLDGSDTSHTATAGQTGAYLISSIPSGYDYVLTPSKDDDPGPETLSSLDSSKIARASIGLVEITDLERLAADVTGNGRISGLDASRVAKYKSGLISQMNDTGKHWTFSPVSAEYSPLDSDMENQDFTAMRLGDISGTWKADPLQRSGHKNQTSEVSETSEVSAEISVKQGAELSVPVVLGTAAATEGIDITMEFDENVLDAEEVTLAGSILENEDYALVANTGMEGKIIAVIYATSYIFTGAGTVATLKFRITGEPGDSTLLTFREFECNRIPVSGSSQDYPHQSGETLSGGFYADSRISQSLKITVSGDQTA